MNFPPQPFLSGTQIRPDEFPVWNGQQILEGPSEPAWLVESMLPVDQPLLICGPAKSRKTTLAVDLLVSLVSGTPFLGQFKVPGIARVLLASGESGLWKLRDTIERVGRACVTDWRYMNNLLVTNALPRLEDPDSVARFLCICRGQGVTVVVLDPLYLCLFSANFTSAINSYAADSVLGRFAAACRAAGVTPVVVHNAGESAAAKSAWQPPQLHDMAPAGLTEFARSWLLVRPRNPEDPGSAGRANLLMSIGGCAGYGSEWELDVDEGPRPGCPGRIWSVQLHPY